MFNKFISGLVVGFGFSIAVIISLVIAANYLLPFSFMSEPINSTSLSSQSISFKDKFTFIENFDELPLDEQIANSTAIIVTKIEKDTSGKYQSMVTEILKKQEDVEMYYQVGDTYDQHSDFSEYESRNITVPNGFIVFMYGNPARTRYSVSYSEGKRITGLGDIPMALLREKCSSK